MQCIFTVLKFTLCKKGNDLVHSNFTKYATLLTTFSNSSPVLVGCALYVWRRTCDWSWLIGNTESHFSTVSLIGSLKLQGLFQRMERSLYII